MASVFDNFANRRLEAIWHKKIVIGTSEQLITNGVNRFFTKVDDPEDLFNKIEFVLNLNRCTLQMIEKSASQSIERLNPDNSVERLICYYKKVIKNVAETKCNHKKNDDEIFNEILKAHILSLEDVNIFIEDKYTFKFMLRLIIKKYIFRWFGK